MNIPLIPLLVLILGALAWSLPANTKIQEMGKIAFFVGLYWAVGAWSGLRLVR